MTHKAGAVFKRGTVRNSKRLGQHIKQCSQMATEGEYFALYNGMVSHGEVPVIDRVMTG